MPRIPSIVLAGVVASTLGCAHAPPTSPAASAAPAMNPGLCDAVQAISRAITEQATSGPPSFLIASAADPADLASAYDAAKLELERCIDPALKVTFTTGREVWPGRPPIMGTAVVPFNPRAVSSFSDAPLRDKIYLGTTIGPGPAELTLSH